VRPVVKAMIARKVNPNVDVTGGHTPLTMAIHDQELMAGFSRTARDTNPKTKLRARQRCISPSDRSALDFQSRPAPDFPNIDFRTRRCAFNRRSCCCAITPT
jgi:hypothetical protein